MMMKKEKQEKGEEKKKKYIYIYIYIKTLKKGVHTRKKSSHYQ